MGDRLTLEQRRVVANLVEVYGSPTVVRQKFAERFAGRDPPRRRTGWDRPVNHLLHIMYVLWLNVFYSLSV